jgi:dimethylamine/trimethylamine dehydrogenase
MGGVVAEKLRKDGSDVVLVTPAADASNFTNNSLEHHRVQKALLEMGVEIIPYHNLIAITGDVALISCGFTDREREIEAASVVLVTAMLPNLALWDELQGCRDEWAGAGIQSIERVGDAHAANTIAAAVWSGHRFAREVGEEKTDGVPFKREIAELAAE